MVVVGCWVVVVGCCGSCDDMVAVCFGGVVECVGTEKRKMEALGAVCLYEN